MWLLTDDFTMGLLQWFSTIVTVGGFWIAILKLKRIQSATDAAKKASDGTSRRERERELVIRLASVGYYLRAATVYPDAEIRAAHAYLDASRKALIEAQQLHPGPSDRDALQEFTLTMGRAIDALTEDITPQDVRLLKSTLREVLGGVEQMEAQLRYRSNGNS
ncbi:MAG: hypothetical protein ACK4MV_10245 [Beijerinckiaceae bacterium]